MLSGSYLAMIIIQGIWAPKCMKGKKILRLMSMQKENSKKSIKRCMPLMMERMAYAAYAAWIFLLNVWKQRRLQIRAESMPKMMTIAYSIGIDLSRKKYSALI